MEASIYQYFTPHQLADAIADAVNTTKTTKSLDAYLRGVFSSFSCDPSVWSTTMHALLLMIDGLSVDGYRKMLGNPAMTDVRDGRLERKFVNPRCDGGDDNENVSVEFHGEHIAIVRDGHWKGSRSGQWPDSLIITRHSVESSPACIATLSLQLDEMTFDDYELVLASMLGALPSTASLPSVLSRYMSARQLFTGNAVARRSYLALAKGKPIENNLISQYGKTMGDVLANLPSNARFLFLVNRNEISDPLKVVFMVDEPYRAYEPPHHYGEKIVSIAGTTADKESLIVEVNEELRVKAQMRLRRDGLVAVANIDSWLPVAEGMILVYHMNQPWRSEGHRVLAPSLARAFRNAR